MKEAKTKSLLQQYVIGFLLSAILTLGAYLFTVMHLSTPSTFAVSDYFFPVIITLAFVQLIVQVLFFLHLWQEDKPRWNLVIFLSTVGLIFIVIVGSIWIMHHLNYNMTPHEMSTQIIKDEGINNLNPKY